MSKLGLKLLLKGRITQHWEKCLPYGEHNFDLEHALG
jgi:hypothetical protein